MYREFISLKEVFGPSGGNRLRLLHESDMEGYEEFHSLSLEKLTVTGWKTEVRLTDEQFQGSYKYHRWIVDLHSFRPESGLAVILVAEASRNLGAYSIDYHYSWRLWDIVKNTEIARLKDCQTPNDSIVYQ